MRCPMCYTTYMPQHLKGVMRWDLFTRLIDEAAANGVYSIKLSWRGEPLLNKRIVDMVVYAKERGIKEVAFLTNAMILTPKMAEALVDAGLDWMSISADGTGEIYNEIRAPAKFDETIERVRYVRDYRNSKGLTRPALRVQSVLSAVENDPEAFTAAWTGVVDRINVITDHTRDFSTKKATDYDHYFVCPKPWQRMNIAHDGRVHQCSADYKGMNILGDCNQQSLSEIWHSEASRKVREAFKKHTWLKENPPCRFCSYGLLQEKSKAEIGTGKAVYRYKAVSKVVEDGNVRVKTPWEKLTGMQREIFPERDPEGTETQRKTQEAPKEGAEDKNT